VQTGRLETEPDTSAIWSAGTSPTAGSRSPGAARPSTRLMVGRPPDSGMVGRPDSGMVGRPDSGMVGRPDSGMVGRKSRQRQERTFEPL